MANKLNCVIIEDQLPAQRILSGYVEKIPNLNLAGVFVNPFKAEAMLKRESIDILFLDIHLPKISGISFLKSLETPPAVIFTTAFPEYALESYDLDVVDYLLKPISFERFLRSLAKTNKILANKEILLHRKEVFIKTKGVIKKISLDTILYIQSKGEFVLLVTAEEKHIVSCSMKEIGYKFGTQFIRCHKSYAVRIAAIEKIIGNRIKIQASEIPIGRAYKNNLFSKLNLI